MARLWSFSSAVMTAVMAARGREATIAGAATRGAAGSTIVALAGATGVWGAGGVTATGGCGVGGGTGGGAAAGVGVRRRCSRYAVALAAAIKISPRGRRNPLLDVDVS